MPYSVTKFYNRAVATLTLLTAMLMAAPAFAQNTGGVFGPVVKEGHKSWQYRATFDPDNAQGRTGFAQRLHYQQAIDDRFMLRILGQSRKTESSDLDFDFVQAELFIDLTEDSQPYQTGLRFDARLRDDNRPGQLGINWMNEWNLDNGWQLRALTLSSVQVGNRSADGVFLQTRGHIAKSIDGGRRVGLEMFNNFGNTENIGSFKTQGHTIGPFITSPVGNNFSIFAGALFGVSEAAADTEFRIWLTKTL